MSYYLERNLLRMRPHEFTCGRASCKCLLSYPLASAKEEAVTAEAFIKVISFARADGRVPVFSKSCGLMRVS